MTRTRDDLARKMAAEMGISLQDARHAVDQFANFIQDWLVAGDTVVFRGAFTLKVVERKAKVGVNPRKPQEGLYVIPPRKVVKFTAGTYLHEALNPES